MPLRLLVPAAYGKEPAERGSTLATSYICSDAIDPVSHNRGSGMPTMPFMTRPYSELCLAKSCSIFTRSRYSTTPVLAVWQLLRVNSEWRRWEEADKWHWDAFKRKRWAEGLWRAQHLRHLRRRDFIRQQELSAARQRCGPTVHTARKQ